MALRSDRQDSKVDPDMGVYVEMEGIMEVRYACDYDDYQIEPEDFMDFQARMRKIPENFCLKDYDTGVQAYYFCLVCNCDLKSLRPLRDHVTGNKHIRKACEKKRLVLGLPQDPQNAPRVKKLKKERPKVDVGLTIVQRLKDCGEPAIGLEYITEFINPKNSSDHPMYTCRLEGCKSAWGTSDDIFNHVIKAKHHKNLFKKLNPEDTRIAGLSSADILVKAAEYEEEQGGSEERDYGVIETVSDYEKYMELRERPDDWSEKKSRLGVSGSSMNSNMEPLGKRGAWGTDQSQTNESSMFDEDEWANWQPPSRNQVLDELRINVTNSVKDVHDMVEEFEGEKGDEKYKEIMQYQNIYASLLNLLKDDFNNDDEVNEKEFVMQMGNDLRKANDVLIDKVEKEDREMKAVSKLMAELEEEIESYHSERDTKKYANIQSRLCDITKEMKNLKPTRSANILLRNKYNERLTVLWKDFEERSDSLVEALEKQMGTKTASQRNHEIRKEAIEKYEKDVIIFAQIFLHQYREKFGSDKELSDFASWVIKNKVLEQEVNMFTKRRLAWENFHLTEKTKQTVQGYLSKKMISYSMGEVYRRN